MTKKAATLAPSFAQRPPLVKGLPLLGSIQPLLKNPHEFVIDAYAKYGNVFRFRAAHREYVVLAGIEANRFVSGEGADFFGVENFWGKAAEHMGCPHLMIAVEGEPHKLQRKAMTPALNQNAYKGRIADLAKPVEDLIAENNKQYSLAVGPLLRQMVSNQIGLNLQNYRTSYKEVEQMIYYFGSIMNVFGLRKWPKVMLYTPKFKWAERVSKRHAKKILKGALARTEAEKKEKPLYLDDIVPVMQARPELFSDGDIAVHALLPFIAALDTVGSTMGFMLHRLLSDPALMQCIQIEVDEVFSHGLPDSKQLRNMEKLNGFIRETMRLQPTGFGITRSANCDFEFEGFSIRKGEDILVFTTADHRNAEFFPEPEKFSIERYCGERKEHKQPAYAPFGKGPHNCLGASLAELIMPLNIALMLYSWNIKSACDLSKVTLCFNPAPVLSENFKISVSKRRV